jgi:hypothetical protein
MSDAVIVAADTTGLVRPLGAFERMYHRYQQNNTLHFCVVAELADDLDPSALEAGLLAVQHRHPLLNVHVEDHPRTRLGFYRPATVPPIPVTVIDTATGHTWRDLVVEELTRPFDTSTAPMVRVVLLRAGQSTPAVIVLTVAHVIVDGISAGYLLRNLFAALNGHPLQTLPVPPSQEELIGRLRDAQPSAALAPNSPPRPTQPPWLATAKAAGGLRRYSDDVFHVPKLVVDGCQSAGAKCVSGLTGLIASEVNAVLADRESDVGI